MEQNCALLVTHCEHQAAEDQERFLGQLQDGFSELVRILAQVTAADAASRDENTRAMVRERLCEKVFFLGAVRRRRGLSGSGASGEAHAEH